MNPYTKLTCANVLIAAGGEMIKTAKDIFNEKSCNRKSHASELLYEEVGPVGKILIKKGANTLSHVHLGITMIKPMKR